MNIGKAGALNIVLYEEEVTLPLFPSSFHFLSKWKGEKFQMHVLGFMNISRMNFAIRLRLDIRY